MINLKTILDSYNKYINNPNINYNINVEKSHNSSNNSSKNKN